MIAKKIVIHTDVFLDHLTSSQSPSILRVAMRECFCYTTVFQAIELFSLARTESEYRVIENSMAAIKLLGLNPKGSRTYGRLLARRHKTRDWNVLIGGLCIESRLPLLTNLRDEFTGIAGLQIVSPRTFTRAFL